MRSFTESCQTMVDCTGIIRLPTAIPLRKDQQNSNYDCFEDDVGGKWVKDRDKQINQNCEFKTRRLTEVFGFWEMWCSFLGSFAKILGAGFLNSGSTNTRQPNCDREKDGNPHDAVMQRGERICSG